MCFVQCTVQCTRQCTLNYSVHCELPKVLCTIYKGHARGCSSVFKSDQPVAWTFRYSPFYSTVYSKVYKTAYSILYSLVFSTV